MSLTFPNGVVVDDPQVVVERYFRDEYLGRAYEDVAHSPANCAAPNRLLLINWRAAFMVHARRMAWADVGKYISDQEDDLIPLSPIPQNADLLNDWTRINKPLHTLFHFLLTIRGVRGANATKLLYPKRRCLIPILDSLVCGMLNVDCPRDADGAIRAIEVFRSSMLDGDNLRQLQDMKAWMITATHIPVSDVVRRGISLIRLYDIVAWSVARRAMRGAC